MQRPRCSSASGGQSVGGMHRPAALLAGWLDALCIVSAAGVPLS